MLLSGFGIRTERWIPQDIDKSAIGLWASRLIRVWCNFHQRQHSIPFHQCQNPIPSLLEKVLNRSVVKKLILNTYFGPSSVKALIYKMNTPESLMKLAYTTLPDVLQSFLLRFSYLISIIAFRRELSLTFLSHPSSTHARTFNEGELHCFWYCLLSLFSAAIPIRLGNFWHTFRTAAIAFRSDSWIQSLIKTRNQNFSTFSPSFIAASSLMQAKRGLEQNFHIDHLCNIVFCPKLFLEVIVAIPLLQKQRFSEDWKSDVCASKSRFHLTPKSFLLSATTFARFGERIPLGSLR